MFKIQLDDWKEKKNVASDMVSFIVNTVTASIRETLPDTTASPTQIYDSIRAMVMPNAHVSKTMLLLSYRQHWDNFNYDNLQNWLTEWMTFQRRGQAINASFIDTVVFDFVQCVCKHVPAFNTHLMRALKEELTLAEAVADFRGLVSATEILSNQEPPTFHSLATGQASNRRNNNPSTDTRKLRCICGQFERYADCPCLNPQKAPPGFVISDQQRENCRRALQDPRMLRNVQRQVPFIPNDLLPSNAISHAIASTPSEYPTSALPPINDFFSLATNIEQTTNPVSSAPVSYRNWWIFDSGSSIHITNDQNNFIDSSFVALDPQKHPLRHGTATSFIQGVGTVRIRVQGREKLQDVKLSNVFFVPDFMANIISMDLVKNRGLFWNHRTNWLETKTGDQVFKIFSRYSASFLSKQSIQDPPLANAVSSYSQHESIASEQLWHRRLGHANLEAIRHLPEHALGVKIDNRNPKGLEPMKPCVVCVESKALRQISRRPMKKGSKPFEHLHFDLIQLLPGINGKRYLLHFFDPLTAIHLGYTTKTREQAELMPLFDGVKKYVELEGYTLKALHHDNESALGGEYDKWVVKNGIMTETTAPYTPEQNGFAERAGAVITTYARALTIQAGLPKTLWPEIVLTVIKILNRTPRRNLQWKTPLEMIGGQKPDLSGLRILGCKAFVRRNLIPRLDKVDTRVWIGYLVGYEASNIYRIWNPSTNRVFKARDVHFDENSLYKHRDNTEEPITIEEDQTLRTSTPLRDGHNLFAKSRTSTFIDLTHDNDEDDNHSPRTPERAGQNDAITPRTPPPPPAPQLRTFSHVEIPSDPRPRAPSLPQTPKAPGAYLASPKQSEPDRRVATYAPSGPLQPWPNRAYLKRPVSSPQQAQPPPKKDRAQKLRDELASDFNPSGQWAPIAGPSRATRSGKTYAVPEDAEMEDVDHQANAIEASLGPCFSAFVQATDPGKPSEHALGLQTFVPYATVNDVEDEHYTLGGGIPQTSAQSPPPPPSSTTEKRKIHDFAPPPKSYQKMLTHPERKGFNTAAQVELRQLIKNLTWTEMSKEEAETLAQDLGIIFQALPLRWIFTYKFDKNGFFVKHKARLVVRGDKQADIYSRQDIYAHTLAIAHFRALMGHVADQDLDTRAYDIVNAFATCPLPDDEVIFIQVPEGLGLPRNGTIVLRLRMGLYGLRKSPKWWYEDLTRKLTKFGCKQIPESPCVWIHDGFQTPVIVFFYVDDLIVAGKGDGLHHVSDFLAASYELHVLGEIEWFVGIRVTRDRASRKLWLSQEAYVRKIAKRFNIVNTAKVPITLTTDLSRNEDQATPEQVKIYQIRIGSILYVAITTRPDVCLHCSLLSDHLLNPAQRHIDAADHLIRYLLQTSNHAILYTGTSQIYKPLSIGVDAAFADNPSRKSTQGYIVKLFGGPILWNSSKQRTVTTSTTEAELLSLTKAAAETMSLLRFFKQCRINVQLPAIIHCDNRQTVDIVNGNTALHATKLRHVDIHQHWLKQELAKAESELQVEWIATADQIADGLTKLRPAQAHRVFVDQIGLVATTVEPGSELPKFVKSLYVR